MGKIKVGPSAPSDRTPTSSAPEQIIVEKPVYMEKIVEVEKIVEKPTIIEKIVDRPVIQEVIKFDDAKIDALTEKIVLTDLKVDDLLKHLNDIRKEHSQAYEDSFDRAQRFDESLDMHSRTLVDIRQIQAFNDERCKVIEHKIKKLEKYNKYLMLGIITSLIFSLIASII